MSISLLEFIFERVPQKSTHPLSQTGHPLNDTTHWSHGVPTNGANGCWWVTGGCNTSPPAASWAACPTCQ
eukprot:5900861-Lingulodinium_polyedra.AAC.1